MATKTKAKPKSKPTKADQSAHDRNKASAAARNLRVSEAGRDIGSPPKCANKARRDKCRSDFRAFCETYFGDVFALAWSPDHLLAIAKIERAVMRGDLFAFAMPRGSGKTTLCETAAIWSLLYGHRRYVVIVGADQAIAVDNLSSIKSHIERNAKLAADFPEVVFPIAKLERIAHRQRGQLSNGKPTFVTWKADEVVLPTIAGSPAGGGKISVVGITGRIRGLKFTRPDGAVVRPDLAIIDDPQSDESARSPSQVATREAVVAGAIVGLAGPGKRIAGFLPCTVIAEDDFADRILNAETHPDWQGERWRLIYDWPTDSAGWSKYREIRDDALRAGKGIGPATEYYRKNRATLDAGARIAWPARFHPDEASAIQSAMNLYFADESAFYAEYQNDPAAARKTDAAVLTSDAIFAKTINTIRGVVPIEADYVTAFVDVQEQALFYVVAAWRQDFTGTVIDYGAFPDQRASYFTLRDLRNPLSKAIKGTAGREGLIYAGLESVVGRLMSIAFRREDGAEMKLNRVLIDANFETDTIYSFCRRSSFGSVVMPAHGRYVGASSKPFSEYSKKPGEFVGHNWRIPAVGGKRLIRHVVFDANYWKSFCESRWLSALGDAGSLTLYKAPSTAHRMFIDHQLAEYKVETTGRGRTVFEWKSRPDRPDNHLLDCVVGSAVAASTVGASLLSQRLARPAVKRTKRRVTYL